MEKPVIGITVSHNEEENTYFLKKTYAKSIALAGGVPLLIPADEELGCEQIYAGAVDGIMLSGGSDVLPRHFGQEPLEGFPMAYDMAPVRDSFEIRLYQEAVERRLPVLGICRGLQLMAVAAGGSIFQDIDSEAERSIRIRHVQKAPDWCETHSVTIREGSKLEGIYKTRRMMINSFHHQAVRNVPEGYQVNAWSDDGMIEGMESLALPYAVGVQWHPERTAGRNENNQELFASFVRAASEYGRIRRLP